MSSASLITTLLSAILGSLLCLFVFGFWIYRQVAHWRSRDMNSLDTAKQQMLMNMTATNDRIAQLETALAEVQQSDRVHRALLSSIPNVLLLTFGWDLKIKTIGGLDAGRYEVTPELHGKHIREDMPPSIPVLDEARYWAALGEEMHQEIMTWHGRSCRVTLAPVRNGTVYGGLLLVELLQEREARSG